MFGICGSQLHDQMGGVTGYCISNSTFVIRCVVYSEDGYMIQGKEIKFTEDEPRMAAGDTIGVFYSWHSKQIIFTRNDKTSMDLFGIIFTL